MEKVYLLLRNNKECGPLSYTQLLSQALVPTDLIWIEGESASWMTPAELEEYNKKKALQVNIRPVPAVVPAAAHIPPPAKLPFSFANAHSFSAIETKPNRKHSLADKTVLLPKEGIDVRIHKKGVKLVSLDQLAGSAFIALVVTTAWFGRHQFFAGKQQSLSFVTPSAFMSEQSFAAKKQIVPAIADTIQYMQDSTIPVIGAPIPRKAATVTKNNPTHLNNQPEEEVAVQEELKTADAAVTKPEVPIVEPAPVIKVEKEPEAVKSVPEQTTDTSAGEEVMKKKSLGQALKGIFRKKNKTSEE